ncbi:6-carboxytetrahydropterin synthase QueD [Thalassobaculum sp.]|uniref:6-carboxytetrahydropterin synthase QueD n=1 Tax=Thalassobaculum sp. TaxID=2022740 RepID=UPI003B5A2EB5
MIEVFKEFTFEAAHQLAANVDPGHPYANIHGHSFKVQVFLKGEPDPETGWVLDFAKFEAALAPIRSRLDHNYLNTVSGLERPTLENIAQYIWTQLETDLPVLDRVIVIRGTCGEGCVFRGRA